MSSEALILAGILACALSGVPGLFFPQGSRGGSYVAAFILSLGCVLGLTGVAVFLVSRIQWRMDVALVRAGRAILRPSRRISSAVCSARFSHRLVKLDLRSGVLESKAASPTCAPPAIVSGVVARRNGFAGRLGEGFDGIIKANNRQVELG